MARRYLYSTLAATLVVAATSCTTGSKLEKYVKESNASLAGRELAPGFYCDGMAIDADTVVITYSFPDVSATPDELNSLAPIRDYYKDLFLRGLVNDKINHPDGIKIITDAEVYMKGVFKFQNLTIDVIATPDEILQALQ